jgi:N-methylhydantoinase B
MAVGGIVPASARTGRGAFVNLGEVPDFVPQQQLPSGEVDPVTHAVIGGALFTVCREMETTLQNASLSPIINIGKDFSCALFTADGRLVTQTCNCPGHVGSMHYAVFACLEKFGTSMEDGAVIVLNDPWAGGTHLPDLTLISPVFHQGALLMFVGNRAHHSDIGGGAPGGLGQARDVYAEGLRIPPTRLSDPLLALLYANVRTPREVRGDLEAQVAAVDAGRAGVRRLVETYGVDSMLAAVRAEIDHSEQLFRAAIAGADGRYAAADQIDGAGEDPTPLPIHAEVIVDSGSVFVDFTGTARQVDAAANSVFATTASMVVTAMLALTDPTITPNHGIYRALHVFAEPGTIVNPLPPAPVAGFPDVCNRIVDVLLKALTPAFPERAIGGTSGTTCNAVFAGERPETGEQYVFYSINHQGGWGGRLGADGWHDVCFIEANGWDLPVETIEYRFPWRVLEYGLRTDAAGSGRWRGGEGSRIALTPLGHTATFSIAGDRAVTPPFGVFGGSPGATARCWIERADGVIEPIAPQTLKADGIRVEPGDVVVIEGTSGGGYGDPRERPKREVEQDIADALLSRERAAKEYGLSFEARPNSETGEEGVER